MLVMIGGDGEEESAHMNMTIAEDGDDMQLNDEEYPRQRVMQVCVEIFVRYDTCIAELSIKHLYCSITKNVHVSCYFILVACVAALYIRYMYCGIAYLIHVLSYTHYIHIFVISPKESMYCLISILYSKHLTHCSYFVTSSYLCIINLRYVYYSFRY